MVTQINRRLPRRPWSSKWIVAAGILSIIAAGLMLRAQGEPRVATATRAKTAEDSIQAHALTMLKEGRKTFRFDTFGDEAFWGGQLQLHRAIKGGALDGVGPGISPRAALELGLKVDVDALTPEVLRAA